MLRGDDLLEVVVEADDGRVERTGERALHVTAFLAVLAIITAGIVLAFSLHHHGPDLALVPAPTLTVGELAQTIRGTCRSVKDDQRDATMVVQSADAYVLVAKRRMARYDGLLESLAAVNPPPSGTARLRDAEVALTEAARLARAAVDTGQAGDAEGARTLLEQADSSASLTCRA